MCVCVCVISRGMCGLVCVCVGGGGSRGTMNAYDVHLISVIQAQKFEILK